MSLPAHKYPFFHTLPYPGVLLTATHPFRVIAVNKSMDDILLQKTSDTELQQSLYQWFSDRLSPAKGKPDEAGLAETCRRVLETGQPEELELLQLYSQPDRNEKSIRFWKPTLSVSADEKGDPLLLLSLVNRTRQRYEEEERLAKSYKLAKIGTWEYDLQTEHLHWSDLTKEVHGFDPDHEPDVESTIGLFKEGYRRETFMRAVEDAIEREKPFDVELKITSGRGDDRWIRATCEPEYENGVCVRFYGISQNVTVRKEQEEQLIESVREKETLLAEIHHRVKNNLAVVSGLLQLQMLREENPGVQGRLKNSIARIQTMSAIHEQLYQAESFSRLNFTDNIRLLAQNIYSSYRADTEVDFQFSMDEMHVTIYQVIPASLIVNEVLTNIFKHAYQDQKNGTVDITLAESSDQELVELTVSDNGNGLPREFDPDNTQSLGLKLIQVLTDQLEGSSSYESTGNGTRFTLRFKRLGRDEIT